MKAARKKKRFFFFIKESINTNVSKIKNKNAEVLQVAFFAVNHSC